MPALAPRPGGFWVHALSVGEVLSAAPLVRRLKEDHPDRPRVLTVTTEQGWEVARRELGREADLMLPMPLDFWPAYRRLARFLRPALYVPVETDLWPGLMHHLRDRGVPTVVVNGRVSPRTAAGYRRLGPLIRPLLEAPSLWLVQSDLDAERLVRSGAPRERVRTAGNIKFDSPWEPMEEAERQHLLRALGLDPGETVWVAGSTHPDEEEAILAAFQRLRERYPGLRLVLAPRRVERARGLVEAARARGLPAAARSGTEAGKREAAVVVLDTLGELGRVYGVGSIAFVGGSLVPVGGHNLLEPARFALPVLFGPHTHNFAAMSEMLLEAGGGIRVEGEESLERAVAGLLARPEEGRETGRRALAFVRSNRGALDRVAAVLEEQVPHGR
jgi:3-deoxy-D-manno-octulosonic-acid transferase